jgi:hypothetical protein
MITHIAELDGVLAELSLKVRTILLGGTSDKVSEVTRDAGPETSQWT